MKKMIAIGLAFSLAAFCSACGSASDTASISSLQAESGSPSAPSDRTVRLEQTEDITGKQIQGAFQTADRLKPYETISDLCQDAAGIVRGEVTSVSYFHIETTACTKMDIHITEVLAGDLQTGDTISVCKSGGYISMRDYLPDVQDRFPELTAEEIDNTVVDVSFEGDPHPSVGQDMVLFLSSGSAGAPAVLSGMYEILGGYLGQLTKGEDNAFARHIEYGPDAASGADGSVGYTLAESRPSIDRSTMTGANRAFAYAQLKNDIVAALR